MLSTVLLLVIRILILSERYIHYRDKIRAVTFVHSEGIYNIENKTDDLPIINSIQKYLKIITLKI